MCEFRTRRSENLTDCFLQPRLTQPDFRERCQMTFGKSITRRALLATASGVLLARRASAGADWPNGPIKLIVPFAPGGSNDILARVLAGKLAERLGQSVIIDNKGGAGGVIGTNYVAKAPPDGYTLLFASTSITTNAAIRKDLPYDPLKDLQPIGEVGAGPFVVVVSNQLGVKTLQEFIDLARSKPKQLNYGTAGAGGINHLGTELLAKEAKIELVHVPYKGIGPAFNDLIAGRLQMLLPTVASVVQLIHSRQMLGLAVTSKERSPLAPELPTAIEAGLPDYELEAWWGLLGPAQMPATVVARLNAELNTVLQLPDVIEVLMREGAASLPGTQEAFGHLISSELTRWKKLISDAHIQNE